MNAYVVIGANECCGCSSPVFIGVYPTEDEARAVADIEDAEVIPYTGAPVVGWAGL